MNIQELNINWYTRYNEYDETNKQKNIISIINNIKSEEKILGIKLLDSFGLHSHYHEYLTDEAIKEAYADLIQTEKKLQVSELDMIKLSENNDTQINRIARTVLIVLLHMVLII